MVLNHAAERKMPKRPSIQKHSFQPRTCAIHPMMGAKRTKAKYCDALKMAEARPRSAVGNQAATMRPLPGKTGACASPETSRNAKIAVKAHAAGAKPASPMRNAHTDHATIAMP